MAKTTTRHLRYAWIEYGNPLDAQAFTDGLYHMGWRNLVSGFPVQKDSWGARHVDASHPLLPIRWRGSALLILPNDRHDVDKDPHPYIDDPLFKAFRKNKGDSAFDTAIREQNKFIAEWVFAPGAKKVSDTESHLTSASDFTDYADLVSISGHGAAGTVWGGGASAELTDALKTIPDTDSDRLKYVLIPSCYNLSQHNAESWMPAFRRKKHPVHGIFGYRDSYPGDAPGQRMYERFASKLRSDGGSKTIIDAYRDSHPGSLKPIWAAMLHVESKKDTMKDWLAGKLAKPDAAGEVRWFSEENYPDGEVVTVREPEFKVHFMMGTTRISDANKGDLSVGLFPGEKGALELSSKSLGFTSGEKVTVVFYYYRPEKDGMDVNKLLKFGTPADGKVQVLMDVNKNDSSKNADAIRFEFTKDVAKQTLIPFTVLDDATKTYHTAGDHNGYFNLKLTPPGTEESHRRDNLRFYPHGAYLRPKKP